MGSHTGSTNSPVCSVVNWVIRSSLSFVIDLSSEAVIAGIRCSTAPLASSTRAEKASRASLRSSFLTASCEGILTSYLVRVRIRVRVRVRGRVGVRVRVRVRVRLGFVAGGAYLSRMVS